MAAKDTTIRSPPRIELELFADIRLAPTRGLRTASYEISNLEAVVAGLVVDVVDDVMWWRKQLSSLLWAPGWVSQAIRSLS